MSVYEPALIIAGQYTNMIRIEPIEKISTVGK